MTTRRNLALVLALALAPAAARADSLVSLPDPAYAAPTANAQAQPNLDRIRALVYPTIGCASYVAPGGVLEPIVLLPNGGGTADFAATIVAGEGGLAVSIGLPRRGIAYDAATGTYRLAFDVPASTPEETYELVVWSADLPGGFDGQPNAVRVLRATTDLEVVHIADSQIRDPTTQFPQKFAQCLAELRLRDPHVVLFSGDINFGLDYAREYEENLAIFEAARLALSCAPGNHDGYAWIDPNDAGRIIYDGLYYWRRCFGPLYYSFRVGKTRFIAANSFDGAAARRNAFTFLTVNAGGTIDAAQLAWIEAEARAATAAGEEGVLFLHHNPSAQVTHPNVQAYPWNIQLVAAGNGTWNDQFSRDEVERIAGENEGLSWIFAGHTNHDEHLVRPLGPQARDVHYVNTTSICNGGNPREGYRWIEVRGGRIAEIDFDAPAAPSVPFPLGGNLRETFDGPNDGSRTEVRARVENALAKPVEVTLRFYMAPDSRGWRASAGRIRDVARADNGAHVVWVRATAPAQGAVEVRVAPATGGGGAQPGTILTGGGGGGRAGSGGSGGGCAAGGAGGGALPVVAMGALAVGWMRRRARDGR